MNGHCAYFAYIEASSEISLVPFALASCKFIRIFLKNILVPYLPAADGDLRKLKSLYRKNLFLPFSLSLLVYSGTDVMPSHANYGGIYHRDESS